MKPTLLQQYKAQELDASWLPFLMNRYQTYNLPTEFVMREPGFVVPTQARIYRTDLFVTSLPGREILLNRSDLAKYAQRIKKQEFKGVWDVGEEVFMVEHYENYGDDGHTEMTLMGYYFVRESGLKLVDRYGQKVFAYTEELWQRSIKAAVVEAEKPWTCDLCGRGAEDCDGLHIGEGFQ
jgi:hypothetical protein